MATPDQRIKVALVDSDPDYLETKAEVLEILSGFIVIKFLSNGHETLLDDIIAAQPDVVVTSVRNKNDRDDKDISGITLAQELASRDIPVFINSFLQYAELARSLELPFVDKLDGSESLIATTLRMLGRSSAVET